LRRYYLSLGSNIEPRRNLADAVRLLGEFGQRVAVSSVYISPPFGTEKPQPDYLNAVLVIDVDRTPDNFQANVVRPVESRLGRERSDDRYAPRTIDIDILMVDEEILEIEHRRIPSREILERSFVAVPLAEVAPDLVHPEEGVRISEIAARFTDDLRIADLKLSVDPTGLSE